MGRTRKPRPARSSRRWTAHGACADVSLLPIEANGSAALAVYKPTGTGEGLEAFGIQVLELSASGIAAIHMFLDPSLFKLFDLPPTRPNRPAHANDLIAALDPAG